MINSVNPTEAARLGYRKGWLYFYYKRALCRFQAWPTPVAECQGEDGAWDQMSVKHRDDFFSYLTLGPYGEFGRQYEMFCNGLWEVGTRQRVEDKLFPPKIRRLIHADRHFRNFLSVVPDAVRKKAQYVGCDLFSTIELFAQVPVAMDLVADDKILTAALARHWEFPAVGKVDWTGLELVIKQRRRDIVAWLGYPCRESIVKALRRVEWVSPRMDGECLKQIFRVLSDPYWASSLAHFDTIDESLIRFLDHPSTRQWLPVSLLQTKGRQLEPAQWEYLSSINELIALGVLGVADARRIRLHGRCLVELRCILPFLRSHSFPAGPRCLDSSIEPLVDASALVAEGEEMANCLGSISYLLSALQGQKAFYRVKSPVRATLSLSAGVSGGWLVDDARGPGNADIAPAVLVSIAESFPDVVGFNEWNFDLEEAVS